MATFVVDPKSGGSSAISSTVLTNTTREEDIEGWFTLAELEGPAHFNSKSDAAIAIQAMESEPHPENAALAAAGVLAYKKVKRSVLKRKAIDEQSAVTTEAKLEAEDATMVKTAMAASMGAENSERMRETLAAAATLERKRAKEAKEAEERAKLPPEEQKAKEELETVKKAWDKSMKEAKALVDRGNRELSEVKVVEAKLNEKSYNKEPLEYLRSNTAATQGVMDSLFSVWIDEKQWNKTSWKLENYSESKTKVVTATATSQAALKQYQDEVLSQILLSCFSFCYLAFHMVLTGVRTATI